MKMLLAIPLFLAACTGAPRPVVAPAAPVTPVGLAALARADGAWSRMRPLVDVALTRLPEARAARVRLLVIAIDLALAAARAATAPEARESALRDAEAQIAAAALLSAPAVAGEK